MRRAAALAASGLLAACASSGDPAPAPAIRGYVAADDISRVAAAIPDTAPVGGSLQPVEPGTDRWWLAIAHVELRPPEAAQHFDCALGTRLAARPRPALERLMARLLVDGQALTRAAAGRHGHAPRPIAQDPDLQPCQRVTPAIRNSPSWPAAAAVAGTLYGEAFAALAPDRAEQARGIGRQIGVSRRVCRMNSAWDVSAGQQAAQALYPQIAASPTFRADLEAARAEIAAARGESLGNPGCAAERRALAATPGGR